MDFDFLSADKPIVKKYELNADNSIHKHSYPFIYEVTSHHERCSKIEDLYQAIADHSTRGHCLLKGRLTRPLSAESRAGTTNPDDPTRWICLDLDGIDNYASVDEFLADIGVGDSDYVLQWSSSQGIESQAGLRCHVFMLLDKETHPKMLKYWLQQLNLVTSNIERQLELTKTGNSLRFPLDITTCQNDKLLYISPPDLGPGISDPFASKPRIELIKRKRRTITLPQVLPTREALRQQVDSKVNFLRANAGLPKRRSTKFKFAGQIEYMEKPDSAVITDVKSERNFVYFNLNGGDSWAYYHPIDNPQFIFNFKGEPVYRTQDLLPEYWARLSSSAQSGKPDHAGRIYLAFRDFKTSNYYNGYYDQGAERLTLAQAKSETQLRQFMAQHNRPMGENVPDWDIIWDPHSSTVVDPTNRSLNIYQPSEYFQMEPSSLPTQIPPTIEKIIDHVLGNDPQTVDHFINWLSVIVQKLTITGTAWVWQGTQGTGKGILFHKILTPIFGDPNVVSKRMEELTSEFTEFMENKFIVFIDEIESGRSLYHNKVMSKLKNLIVEPTISIRKMYTSAFNAKNYANMIFASNKSMPVEVDPDDRRYNVGPYQTKKIQISSHEIDELLPQELPVFMNYLLQYPADTHRARNPLVNEARRTLINIGRTAIDTVSDALLQGDLEFLWDHLPSSKHSDANSLSVSFKLEAFKNLMVDLVKTGENKLSRDDLLVIFDWCIGNMPMSPNKFSALLKHHRIHMKQIWKDNRNIRGIEVTWRYDATWHKNALQEIAHGAI
jgi:hypothetical protein